MRKGLVLAALLLVLLGGATAAIFAGDPERCTAPADECVKKMHAKLSQVGWLGIEKEKSPEGARVAKVIPGSPAAAAGFQVGDVIVAVNGVDVMTKEVQVKDTKAKEAAAKEKEMQVKLKMQPGSTATYTVLRNGVRQDLSATLAPMPHEQMAQAIGEHMLHSHVQ